MAETPFKLRSGNTTPFKQMGSTPAKQKTDWEAMHQKAKDKYDSYDDMTTEEYKTEALRQSAHKKEHGTWDVGGKDTKKREVDAKKKEEEKKARLDKKETTTTKKKETTEKKGLLHQIADKIKEGVKKRSDELKERSKTKKKVYKNPMYPHLGYEWVDK